MKYASQYLRLAAVVIGQYDGSTPLAVFLKLYFASNRQSGSKDRKHISQLCYCYYRLGHALKDLPLEERMRLALFLCQPAPGIWEGVFEKQWIDQWVRDLPSRILFAQQQYPSFEISSIFPWQGELGHAYDAHAFTLSHLIQPDLFLRVRPGHHAAVRKKLETAGISFTTSGENCLVLPNASKIDEVLAIDKEVVIQDISSQKVSELLQSLISTKKLRVWDCCAASGGKSILAWDTLPQIRLTASDIRDSIIRNLRKRFSTANVQAENVFVADLSQKNKLPIAPFDLVICDAPCSGSGTWSRTPEQLFYFEGSQIDSYALLQEKIGKQVLEYIKPGGYLLYITCSVFARENELVAEKMAGQGMQIIEMKWLKGYDQKADSMFAALLQKQ